LRGDPRPFDRALLVARVMAHLHSAWMARIRDPRAVSQHNVATPSCGSAALFLLANCPWLTMIADGGRGRQLPELDPQAPGPVTQGGLPFAASVLRVHGMAFRRCLRGAVRRRTARET
jgi:hypothetical protein